MSPNLPSLRWARIFSSSRGTTLTRLRQIPFLLMSRRCLETSLVSRLWTRLRAFGIQSAISELSLVTWSLWPNHLPVWYAPDITIWQAFPARFLCLETSDPPGCFSMRVPKTATLHCNSSAPPDRGNGESGAPLDTIASSPSCRGLMQATPSVHAASLGWIAPPSPQKGRCWWHAPIRPAPAQSPSSRWSALEPSARSLPSKTSWHLAGTKAVSRCLTYNELPECTIATALHRCLRLPGANEAHLQCWPPPQPLVASKFEIFVRGLPTWLQQLHEPHLQMLNLHSRSCVRLRGGSSESPITACSWAGDNCIVTASSSGSGTGSVEFCDVRTGACLLRLLHVLPHVASSISCGRLPDNGQTATVVTAGAASALITGEGGMLSFLQHTMLSSSPLRCRHPEHATLTWLDNAKAAQFLPDGRLAALEPETDGTSLRIVPSSQLAS
eukprot:m.36436 g.36436  ORF g.36436 m.36436 type:complete len:442 (+) comp5778_c0_seq4:260-1585(+)